MVVTTLSTTIAVWQR